MREIYAINHGQPVLVDDDVFDLITGHKFVLGIDRRILRKLYDAVFGPDRADLHVDHINKNPLDNRRENLRLVTASENMRNRDRAGDFAYKRQAAKWERYSSEIDQYPDW